MEEEEESAPRGLTRSSLNPYLHQAKSMRLKLSGNVREVSERRQVGDAEGMFEDDTKGAWWRNVGMEEGM